MKKIIAISLLFLAATAWAAPLVIYQDSFDSNKSTVLGWYRSNKSYITRYTGARKVGTASLQLRKNYQAIVYLKAAPFKSMVLTFKMAAYSLESGEYIRCQYSTGGSWITAKTLYNGADNGVFRSYSVSIPNCNLLKVRFFMNANSTYDYGYVDDVKLTGYRK